MYSPSREGDYINDSGASHGHPVDGSVLYRLRALTSWLARSYCRAWNPAQITWFVLTGKATPVTAVTGCIGPIEDGKARPDPNISRRKTTITLSVEPWVPAPTIKTVYRKMQREIIGHDNREVPKRRRFLFHFVVRELRDSLPEEGLTEQQAESYRDVIRKIRGSFKGTGARTVEGGRPPWRMLREEWNRKYSDPEWRYTQDSNFSRDFYSAAGLMLRSQQR